MATSQTCCHLPGEMLNSAAECVDRAPIGATHQIHNYILFGVRKMKLFSALHHFYAMSTFPYVGCSRTAYLYSIYYNVRAIFYLAIQTLQKVILRIFIHPFIHPVCWINLSLLCTPTQGRTSTKNSAKVYFGGWYLSCSPETRGSGILTF
jgi:hypothetical protein